MNPLDIVVIVVLSYCFIRGIFRGIISEVTSVVGVIGGAYLAYRFYQPLGQVLTRWINETPYIGVISFMLIFCGVMVGATVAGMGLKYLLDKADMKWFDRLGGIVIGLAKGLLICAVVVVALTALLPENAPLLSESMLAPYITVLAEKAAAVASEEMKQNYNAKIKELKNTWENPAQKTSKPIPTG